MNEDWYPGIKTFCAYWQHAPMLQQTLASLEGEFAKDRDASIDAAKTLVECACLLLIEELDDPAYPKKPKKPGASLGELLGVVVQLLDLRDVRDKAFAKLISEHNRLANALRKLRNQAGTLSHGKDGFLEKLSIHHRRGAILAADAIVTFLHEAYLESEKGPDPVRTLEPYERFGDGNAMIDDYTRVVVSSEDVDFLHLEVWLPNGDEISLSITPSQLLFGVDRQAYKQALNACKEATDSPDKEAV